MWDLDYYRRGGSIEPPGYMPGSIGTIAHRCKYQINCNDEHGLVCSNKMYCSLSQWYSGYSLYSKRYSISFTLVYITRWSASVKGMCMQEVLSPILQSIHKAID